MVANETISNNEAKLTVVACQNAYFTLLGISGGLLVVSLIAMLLLHSSFWQFAVVWFFVSVGIYVWLRSFKLRMTENGISIVTLFSRPNSLGWSEIEKADFRIGYKAKYGVRDSFKPPFRLVLVPRPSTGKTEIAINLKLLSRNDIAQIVETLESKLEITVERNMLRQMLLKLSRPPDPLIHG